LKYLRGMTIFNNWSEIFVDVLINHSFGVRWSPTVYPKSWNAFFNDVVPVLKRPIQNILTSELLLIQATHLDIIYRYKLYIHTNHNHF